MRSSKSNIAIKFRDFLWFVKNLLKTLVFPRIGIRVGGISSDGDTRLLKSMMYQSKNLFSCNSCLGDIIVDTNNICCIQDVIHILTKLRNRLLKLGIVLPMGNKIVSNSHLKILINNVKKDIHGLVMKDIDPDDRMNYSSMEKVMQPRVLEALTAHVPNSDATVMYIKICSEIASSLYSVDLSPTERIYKIWHATFFFRIWKKWLKSFNCEKKGAKKTKTYKLSENFITSNTYSCIEINAHNLISSIKMFRDNGLDAYFLPVLFNSQPNEELFRQLRSMGTINFTKINFTMLELLHMVSRVELQNEIIYKKLLTANVIFPRNKITNVQIGMTLPTDEEITKTICTAKLDAIADACKFSMISEDENEVNIDININDIFESGSTEDDIAEIDNVDDIDNVEHRSGSIHDETTSLRSSYVEMETPSGAKKKVRKSTALWLLTEEGGKLSNDRLRRVTNAGNRGCCRRRLQFAVKDRTTFTVEKNEDLQIGDWVLFRGNDRFKDKILLGHVLSFQYIGAKNAKDREIKWDFVTIADPKSNRRVEVLASWLEMKSDARLEPVSRDNSYFIDIAMYVATVRNPVLKNSGTHVSIDESQFDMIQKYIENKGIS